MSVLLEKEKHFANVMFYVIKNNVTNITSEDLAIQLRLLTLHNKATSKVNSQALSTNNIYLDNASKNKLKLQKNFQINITRFLKVWANIIKIKSIYLSRIKFHQWLKRLGAFLVN